MRFNHSDLTTMRRLFASKRFFEGCNESSGGLDRNFSICCRHGGSCDSTKAISQQCADCLRARSPQPHLVLVLHFFSLVSLFLCFWFIVTYTLWKESTSLGQWNVLIALMRRQQWCTEAMMTSPTAHPTHGHYSRPCWLKFPIMYLDLHSTMFLVWLRPTFTELCTFRLYLTIWQGVTPAKTMMSWCGTGKIFSEWLPCYECTSFLF